MRVKEVSGSTTTVYVFSGSKVIAEYDNGAAVGWPSREYVYAGGALLAKFESGGTTYYHPDHLSNRVLSDASGNILGQRGNFPFGEIWYESGTTTKLKFTSYERDAESGNDFAMARYYINRLARFSALDPMSGSASAPQSLNRYSYSGNDPVNAADPSGMMMIFGRGFYDASGTGGFWGMLGEFDAMDIPVRIGTMYHFEFDARYHPAGGWDISSLLSDEAYGEGGITHTTSPIYGFLISPGASSSGSSGSGSVGGGPKKYAVDLKVLNDCLSKMGIKTTISSLTPSTPGGSGEAKGVGVDWFSGHGNTVPITVINDANTYNAAQVGQMCNLPWAQGCTDRTHPYTNYTNNNNNAYGTVDTQVWELGNSLWQIQAGSPVVPWPTVEPGKTLENCVRTHNGIQPQ